MSTKSHTPERALVAFATGWGSEFGGINVFNSEFLQYLAFATQGHVQVVCIVPAATTQKIEHARKQGVTLIPLPYRPADAKLDSSHAQPVVDQLENLDLLRSVRDLVWLGHDRITGAIALGAKVLAGGRVAMIHHMSYTHYEAYAESASSAYEKSEQQRILFEKADVLFAIGPLLRDALADLLPGRKINTLIPGLDELPVRPSPHTFTGFMSGRLTPDAAKIKQSHLGVAAFANAHGRTYTDAGLPDALRKQPRLILRGADMESEAPLSGQPEDNDWRRFAESYAHRVVNVQALPYTNERSALLDELSRATVALMPSWHEGFGLVGWEAVAAGVPLILSQNSGLYQLLREHRNGAWLNWVFAVDVRGRVDEPYFHTEDLRVVSDRLLEIAKNPAAAREKAASLREGASTDFPWRKCADAALVGLKWFIPEPGIPVISAPTAQSLPHTVAPTWQLEFPLEVPSPRWHFGSGLAESQLLRAEEAAVPFQTEREPELEALVDWAQNAHYSQALRLITGAGGTGKTRLALELCRWLNKEDWLCGFLPSDIGPAQVSGAWDTMRKHSSPLLVVFDYAETRQETLIAFVRLMLQAATQPQIRILLLARDGGEWWDRLRMKDASCEPFLSGYATSGPHPILPLHNSIAQREAAYTTALKAYADRLEVDALPQINVDLSREHFERPLYVQMAAFLALRGERPASAEGLTKALMHHEQRYWARLMQDLQAATGLVGVNDTHAAELMTLSTLAGGFARLKDAQQLWKMWSNSAGRELDGSQQRILFERLAALYPGQRGLQPLRPDLLGEALTAHALLQQTGPALLDALLGSHSQIGPRRYALTVLARISKHRPEIESVVVQSLYRSFLSTAVDVLDVATRNESYLPDWAEKAFLQLSRPGQYQAVGILMPVIQHESVQLAEFACTVSSAAVEKCKSKWEKKPTDLTLAAEYASTLQDHAVFLARVGRGQMALIHAQESFEICEALAKKRAQFESDLAISLGNLAVRLAENGRFEEAATISHKAVQVYQKLASASPAHEPNLGRALSNYAIGLARAGDHAEALVSSQKALQIFERLAAKNPNMFEADYALILNQHGLRLIHVGRYIDALPFAHSASMIYERSVGQNADRYEPSLGIALYNYGLCLADCGEYAEALYAVRRAAEIAVRLSLHRPAIHEESAYLRTLAANWLEWVLHLSTQLTVAAPDPSVYWMMPHILSVLQANYAWVQGCCAEDPLLRADAFKVLLTIGEGLSDAQYPDIEPLWICAWAWWNTHHSEFGADRIGNGLERWNTFILQREGRLPSWMKDAAHRMRFTWPALPDASAALISPK
jgi:glycosyltransferase involved in cell wall biosynthesis/tetratricopeptide (TPR) repeat protein